MRIEDVLFWSAVVLYGLSAFGYIFGFIARAEKLFWVGLAAAALGFLPHAVSIGVRWATGVANPFITIAESIALGIGVSVLLYLLVQLLTAKVRSLGVLVMPVAFVMMGWAGTLRKAPSTVQLVPALQSPWLWVHIVGASIGFSSVLIAAALGLQYLLREGRSGGFYDKVPAPAVLDDLSYRFVVGGFTMYGLMIVSGAFWANQVKGNYWGWDPVEVWSLVSWLVYGIYLHLRITMGWRGRRLAWYSLAAVAVMIVSYWGIPFSVETFHKGFRVEH
jgi:cytochrome c-type biogenesis protein CcsB